MPKPANSTSSRREPLLVLEFNELCPSLLARWMGEGVLPNFARLHASSEVFTTRADVDDAALLEPWIQWYSIHSGLPYHEHRVFHLTEGARAGHDDVWRMLMAAGRSVCSFASMNVAPFAEAGSVFVGDPWTENGDAWPAELNTYNRFVSHNVREYSNAKGGMGAADYARFLAFMGRNGLHPSTVAQIVAQLGTEKLRDPGSAWRRVALLDRLQFDVFRSTWKRYRPDFSTFFVNSVAHLQHSYWRHMDPGPFTVRPDAAEMARYGDAIRFGYRALDKLLGDVMAMARREGIRVMFASALSQQPFLRHEEMGGQHFYRLHDVTAFLKRMGLAALDVDPTMTHQYLARFASPEEAAAAKERLAALRLGGGADAGRAVIGFPLVDAAPDSLYFGCQVYSDVAADTPITDARHNAGLGFGELFYKIEAIKSGCHHPDGCLWIQGPRHRVHVDKVSILDVLPTQLDMMGVRPPAGLAGRSLMPAMSDELVG